MRVESTGYGGVVRPDPSPREEAVNVVEVQDLDEDLQQILEELAEQQDVVSRMQDALKKDEDCWWKSVNAEKQQRNVSMPKDKSAQLTRRLVAASGQFEVRGVISEAGSNLVNLQMAAALCKGKEAEAAKSAIRRLEKLMSRAGRKIKDLDKEDVMRGSKKKAEKKKQQKRAEEIKQELRKKQQKRMSREHSYLLGNAQGASPGRVTNPFEKADTATEAQIALQAEAIAAAEICAEVGAAGVDLAVAGGEGGEIAPGVSAGAEAGGSAEVNLDVSV